MRFKVLLVVFGLALAGVPAAAEPGAGFGRSEVWIETAPGRFFRFDVELATTPAQRAQGLMHRERLAPDAGMLFLFERVEPLSFWMKNTLIPLDMLFLAADGRIINIHARTTPLDLGPHRSAGPAAAVLEINGGVSELLGIEAGDRVIHDAFGNAGAAPATGG